jgi:hypothetical protein
VRFAGFNTADIGTKVGWLLFALLLVCAASGYYVFNPFAFGAIYYVLYVFSHLDSKSSKDDQNGRVIILGIVAILYSFFGIKSGIENREFRRKLDNICINTTAAEEGICNSVLDALDSSHISISQSDE